MGTILVLGNKWCQPFCGAAVTAFKEQAESHELILFMGTFFFLIDKYIYIFLTLLVVGASEYL